jgi:hypothetical protein
MSEFINFNKRGVTLPPGCKDLIDLLRPKVKPSIERAQSLTLTRNETITGALQDVGKYTHMAFESRGAIFTLVITPTEGRLEVHIDRMKGKEPWVSLTFPKDPEEERAVREFFTRKGLQLPEDSGMPPSFFPNLPVQLIYDISPLPRDAAGVSALVADLLRHCGKLGNDAPLRFNIWESFDAD